jgi:hypothetical protein
MFTACLPQHSQNPTRQNRSSGLIRNSYLLNKQMIIDNSCLGLANTQYERFTPFYYNPPRCFQKKISGRVKHTDGVQANIFVKVSWKQSFSALQWHPRVVKNATSGVVATFFSPEYSLLSPLLYFHGRFWCIMYFWSNLTSTPVGWTHVFPHGTQKFSALGCCMLSMSCVVNNYELNDDAPLLWCWIL